tara:strand:- start:42 stop:404 length:363 start_codon:yes stop_codon:yes gene_type:complete
MGRKRRRPSPPPDNTAQLVAEANKRAAEDAEKARKDHRAQIEAMQAKAEAERKKADAIARTPSPTKIGSTMGSAEQGLTRKKQYDKRKRAKKASDLRIALAPAASPMADPGSTQGQPTIS